MKFILNIFIALPVIIYASTGLLKLFLLFVTDRTLDFPNPIFPMLSNKFVLLSAAFLELGCAATALMLKSRNPKTAFAILLWITFLVMFYRLALDLSGAKVTNCHCLGLLERVIYPPLDEITNLLTQGLLVMILSFCLLGYLMSSKKVTIDSIRS
jgi:uncharacterized membrane protein YGL010W